MTTRHTPRRRRWPAVLGALALPLLLLSVTVPAHEAGAAPGRCANATTDGPWTVLPTPDFMAGPLLHVEVSGEDEQVMVIADRLVVARSDDGGCTWRELFRVPPTSDVKYLGKIKDVEVSVDADHDVVFVSVLNSSKMVLLRSERGGVFQPVVPGAFMSKLTGSPPCFGNDNCEIVVSEADPARVFVHGGGLLEGGGQLWRSDDHGLTFRLVHHAAADPFVAGDPANDIYLYGPMAIRTDPVDRDALVAIYNCDFLARSQDGGMTWTPFTRPGLDGGDPFMGLSVRRTAPTAPERMVAVEMSTYCTGASTKQVHRSLDGGQTWEGTTYAGPDLHAIELDSAAQVAVFVDEDGIVNRFDVESVTAARVPLPPGGLGFDPHALSAPGTFALAGVQGVLLLALEVDPGGVDAPPVDIRPGLPPLEPCPRPADPAPPSTPSAIDIDRTVTAGVGEQVSLPAAGTAGSGPVPVDVTFLIDDSGSMSETQQSLARSVGRTAERLRADAVDLQIGLARFADLGALPYQRMLDVSPVDCRLDQRLTQFDTEGLIEPHLLALEQTITGSGLDAVGLPPGDQMSFRPGSVALVAHATDETFFESEDERYPTLEEVGRVYREAGVRHLGLQVGGTNLAGTEDDLPVDPDDVRADLARISTVTGSLATEPIDCNGDGLTDIATGDPLVCGFDANLIAADGLLATEVGSIVAQVVDGLVGPVEVALTIEDAPSGLTARVDGTRTFDPREGGQVPGTLSLTCDRPVDDTLVIGLRAGSRLLTTTQVDITCTGDPTPPSAAAPDARPGPQPGLPAPVVDAPATGAALAPPGPPPPVVQIPAPAPAAAAGGAAAGAGAASSAAATSLGAASDPAAGAAAAAAPEHRRTHQHAQVGIQPTATSATDDGDLPLAAVPLAGGTLTTAALTAHLLATRRRGRHGDRPARASI